MQNRLHWYAMRYSCFIPTYVGMNRWMHDYRIIGGPHLRGETFVKETIFFTKTIDKLRWKHD